MKTVIGKVGWKEFHREIMKCLHHKRKLNFFLGIIYYPQLAYLTFVLS